MNQQNSSKLLVNQAVNLLQDSHNKVKYPGYSNRLNWISTIEKIVLENHVEISKRISQDFINRSVDETYITEVLPVISAAKHAKKNLKRWMKRKRVSTNPIFWFGSSSILPQPLGVVAIISPWNYPLQLSLIPSINALSAGNRVLIKPSEKTPCFSLFLEQLISSHFEKSVIQIINGDLGVSKEISCCANLDHIFFTGSTNAGREIAVSAAKNLIPITLELGGKSPTYISESADLKDSARRVARAKFLNCGQTCIAPDYVLVHESHKNNFIEIFLKEASELYINTDSKKNVTHLLNFSEISRIKQLEDDAILKGATIFVASKSKQSIKVIINCKDNMKLMTEEIFGNLLPVIFIKSSDDAIDYVNARSKPLAIYLFGKDALELNKWLRNTSSGGVTINDCILHVAQDNLPFGGIGKSGFGHYHGVWGFNNFSKLKPIFTNSKISFVGFFMPPFGKIFNKFVKYLRYFI